MTVDTDSAQWVEVANLDDLWEGEMVQSEVGGEPLILVNVAGEIFAYADRCPHLGTQLSSGRCLEDDLIVCPSHQWMFEAAGGTGLNPESACLRRYATRLDGDSVLVSVDVVVQELRGL
jgi:toluene monooxygenase system ferredoxin subunit